MGFYVNKLNGTLKDIAILCNQNNDNRKDGSYYWKLRRTSRNCYGGAIVDWVIGFGAGTIGGRKLSKKLMFPNEQKAASRELQSAIIKEENIIKNLKQKLQML